MAIQLVPVPGVSRLSPEQVGALQRAADQIGIPVDWLATVISFETGGSFSPSVLNQAGSGAFGLIQFMPSTAQNLLGTATREQAVAMGKSMSFEEQLMRMVVPYLANRSYSNLEDVYLQIFYPVARNKPSDYIIGSSPSAVYTQNAGFDREKKGYITKDDVTRKIRSLYASAGGPVLVETAATSAGTLGQFLLGVVIAAAMTWGVYTRTDVLQGEFRIRKTPREVPL